MRFFKYIQYCLIASILLGSCKEQDQIGLKEAKAIIFCLHDIDGKGPYSLKREQLEMILAMLHGRREVLSLRDWVLAVSEGKKFSKTPVILTFDDGYPSLWREVLPMLIKLNFG